MFGKDNNLREMNVLVVFNVKTSIALELLKDTLYSNSTSKFSETKGDFHDNNSKSLVKE